MPSFPVSYHAPMAKTAPSLRNPNISVRGAREHNLKGVDLDIPRDQLVVITGLSGSGKSSLAFDTIFAEGQRKYMESLSAYARQFLDQLKKPDVESIEGLPPTIAIEQRTSGHNPRSTVATSTEIYDYLRLLFARCGKPTCWHPVKAKKDGRPAHCCGEPITASNPSQIADQVAKLKEGTRLLVLAPVVREKKGHHAEVMEDLIQKGFVRARVNGKVVDLTESVKPGVDNPLKLGRYEKHSIEAVVDRVVVRADARQRLAESVETALKMGEGMVIIAVEATGARMSSSASAPNGKLSHRPDEDIRAPEEVQWTDTLYSEKFSCAEHPECALPELEPRIFSFNSPFGACPTCDGIGTLLEFDEALCVPDESKSLEEGAVAVWTKNGPWSGWFKSQYLRKFCKKFGASMTVPFSTLSAEHRRILLRGTTAAEAEAFGAEFEGVIPQVTGWWKSTETENVKEFLTGFMSQTPCPSCCGDRLKPETLAVFLDCAKPLPGGKAQVRHDKHGLTDDAKRFNIADFCGLSITEALEVLESLRLSKEGAAIATPILREIKSRLGFLASVGLEYLSLDRRTATLSGGEAQRIRLATQVGSGLVGACYVLDEPTIGLHQRDNTRLIKTLRHLCDIGNTVIVVEHDREMIEASDYLVDMGPGAGVHGGSVVAKGTVKQVMANKESLTGKYLSNVLRIEPPAKRRPLSEKKAIVIKGAKENNLKNVDAAFPLGGLLCVTGVSGSGKSTLVNDILLAAAQKEIGGVKTKPGAHAKITGLQHLQRVVEVDQTPIGRTPRSNPATYVGFFDEIRKLFAASKESKARGYEPGRFSFNVKGGRCESCQGQGNKKIEMHFLPDVFVECEVCRGTRYNRETLEILWKGKNIAEVLDLTVEEACGFFENNAKVHRCVQCLHDVGLDYVKLGQPSTELSGGEAQRIKLSAELSQVSSSPTLYVLDEPTTGLHFEDVRKLVAVLQRLADAGHSLVVIEHNLDVIQCADWLVDMGPEGGAGGGKVIACGTPEQVAKVEASHTGRYLRGMVLEGRP